MERKGGEWESGKKEPTELDNSVGVKEEEREDNKHGFRFSSLGSLERVGILREGSREVEGVAAQLWHSLPPASLQLPRAGVASPDPYLLSFFPQKLYLNHVRHMVVSRVFLMSQ